MTEHKPSPVPPLRPVPPVRRHHPGRLRRWCKAKIRAAALAQAHKGFAAVQTDKARELIDLDGLVPTARPGVFRAVSSKGDRSYLTRPATCGCPAGRRGKATPLLPLARHADRRRGRKGGLTWHRRR